MAGRSLEKVGAAKAEIEAAGIKGTLSTVQLDVTDETSIKEAAAYIEHAFGGLDVLVNNAASGNRDPDVKTRFQECMDVNVVGPAVVSKTFIPILLKSPNPYSIYITSGGGSMGRSSDPRSPNYRNPAGLPNGDAYRVSKAAINMLALQEYIEYSDTALKVFAASPGFIRSNLRGESEEFRSGWGKADDPEVAGQMVLNIILGKRDADIGKLLHRESVIPW